MRHGLPGQGQVQSQAQGDQHDAACATCLASGKRDNYDFFLDIPDPPRDRVRQATSRGRSSSLPLFEYSGACNGCGETPYLKLLTPAVRRPAADRQRHRLLVDLRRQPADHAVGTNPEGRGPAWSNSLFEDNAEFGLGFRLSVDSLARQARHARTPAGRRLRRRSGPGDP